MHVPWGKIIGIAGRVGAVVLTGVPITETLATSVLQKSGAAKREAVLQLVQAELALAEAAAGRDLANDPDVLRAAGSMIDAFVGLKNVLSAKALPPAD